MSHCEFIVQVQTIVSRQENPRDPSVVTIGDIHVDPIVMAGLIVESARGEFHFNFVRDYVALGAAVGFLTDCAS